MPFLRRNYNILHILFDRNKGASFHKVVSSVRNQIFNCFSGLRKQLYLIEYYYTFTFIQLYSVMDREKHI